MANWRRALALTLTTALAPGYAWAQAALTNADVVRMVKAGLAPTVVAQAIQSAPATAFDTSPDGLIALKAAGVPDTVLTSMLSTTSTRRPRASRSGGRAGRGPAPPDTPVDVPDGTDVRLRLLTAVSSATAQAGDPIRFAVLDAVRAGGVMVIDKGATALGRVSDVRPGGALGRAGSLSFSIDTVTAVDGTPIPLRFDRDVRGASKTVDAVSAAVGGLSRRSVSSIEGAGKKVTAKGADVTIRTGTEYAAHSNGGVRVTGRRVP
jgi:hypothetical protein